MKEVMTYGEAKLTREEIDRKKLQIGEILEDSDRIEDDNKNLRTRIKENNAQLKANETSIKKLSKEIRSGVEFRDIPCRIEYNTVERKKYYIDNETGEIIKSDHMTSEDMQLRFPEEE